MAQWQMPSTSFMAWTASMIFGHSRLVGPRPLLTMPNALAPRSRASAQAWATSAPSIIAMRP